MNCPKCKSLLQRLTFHDHEVHRCQGCQGLWFARLEAQQLAKIAGSEKLDTGDPQRGKALNAKSDVDCPECHTNMIKMVDLKQPHIWYESCKVCGGLFFDAGEFRDYKQSTLMDFFKDLFAKERR